MGNVRKTIKTIAGHTPVAKKVLSDRTRMQQAINILNHERQDLINQVSELRNLHTELRALASHTFLRGSGIEIGALHMPLPLPPHAKVRYVDYLNVEGLRKHYPELIRLPLVNVDIVDNGERLTKVKQGSTDFIVANHFLEHCQDPIGTLITFYKKLRPDGVMYMCIPNKLYTFDMDRTVTTYDHLLEEHKVSPSTQFYLDHCREIAEHTEKLTTEAAIEECIQCLVEAKYSIHYHVWTQHALSEFFHKAAQDFSLKISVDAVIKNHQELICIIRKLNPAKENAIVTAHRKEYFKDMKPIRERLGLGLADA
jgi:predicted SAM-dependent methyltransferase